MWSFVKNSILWIILLGAVGLWYYRVELHPQCAEPIKYTLGTVDSRFHLSKTDFQSAINEATEVWERATGKNLFDYDAKPPVRNNVQTYLDKYLFSYFVRGDIPVNLVYDDRQATAQTRGTLLNSISETKETADQVKAQFLSLQQQYKTGSAEYESMLVDYRSHRISYQTLEAKRLEVNSLADQVNALVKKYNSYVGDINATVKTINQTAGQEFEEGQYVSDADGERINIYEFDNHTTLVRVLAHELGHALGLEHNDNPDSIMYYLNNSTKMVPTKDDLSDLAAICKAK